MSKLNGINPPPNYKNMSKDRSFINTHHPFFHHSTESERPKQQTPPKTSDSFDASSLLRSGEKLRWKASRWFFGTIFLILRVHPYST